MKNQTVLILTILLAVTSWVSAQGQMSQGEKLERQMWTDIESKNWSGVEGKIAEGFQSVHPDGPRDRSQEITLLENLNLKGKTTLSDFKVTENGKTRVVNYMISVREMIAGKELPSKPAPRLSVWIETAKGWQWIAHANLNPM